MVKVMPSTSCVIEEQPRFLLIYGTQTGQAKAISEELAERSERAGLVADIHCFSKVDKEVKIWISYKWPTHCKKLYQMLNMSLEKAPSNNEPI